MEDLPGRGFFMDRRQKIKKIQKKTFDTICKEAVKRKELCRERGGFVSEKGRKL